MTLEGDDHPRFMATGNQYNPLRSLGLPKGWVARHRGGGLLLHLGTTKDVLERLTTIGGRLKRSVRAVRA